MAQIRSSNDVKYTLILLYLLRRAQNILNYDQNSKLGDGIHSPVHNFISSSTAGPVQMQLVEIKELLTSAYIDD